MKTTLRENQKINLSKSFVDLKKLILKPSWSSDKDMDIDFSIFMLNIAKRAFKNSDLIYFGNAESFDNTVSFIDGFIEIDLSLIMDNYYELSIVTNVYKAFEKNHSLKDLNEISISLINKDTNEDVLIYTPTLNRVSNFDGLQLGSFMRRNNEWYFNSTTKEVLGGLKTFCSIYGVDY